MKLEMFVEELKKQGTNTENYVKSHIVCEYLPFEDKITACELINRVSMYKTVSEDRRVVWSNTPMRYMLFIITFIQRYTDIEVGVNKDNLLNEFNTINKYGVCELFKTLLEDEYRELETVLKMTVKDIVDNERSLVPYIDNKIDVLEMLFDTWKDFKYGEENA